MTQISRSLLIGALCLAGCSAAANSGKRGQSQNGAAGSGTFLGASTGACTQNNLTQACGCSASMPGRQTCVAGTWSTCECAAAAADGGVVTGDIPSFAGNNRSDITFVWERTPSSMGSDSCLPGSYEGNFGGVYYSILAPNGLGVPVANFDAPGQPSDFHFTVEPAEGGESIHRIKGQMKGRADGTFPFGAMIEGELDCKTATFTAKLIDGSYSVLMDGLLPQKFDGVMSGHYDKRTHTFVDGEWDVRETSANPPGMLAPTQPRDFKRDGYGGSGSWAAGLPTDVNDAALTQCPTNYMCKGGPLGPNKLLCNGALGVPTCLSDADCNMLFPGEGVTCLKATAFSMCIRECKP
jgi:hypothetical protein